MIKEQLTITEGHYLAIHNALMHFVVFPLDYKVFEYVECFTSQGINISISFTLQNSET